MAGPLPFFGFFRRLVPVLHWGRMRRSFTSIFTLLFFSLAAVAHGADAPGCSALLDQDAALVNALPDRLRPIVESAHFHALLTNREASWGAFHAALDRGLVHEGKPFTGRVGDLGATMVFKRTKDGTLQLWIGALEKGGFPFGAALIGAPVKTDGFQFLEFMGAELGWILKARAAGTLKGSLEIVGRDIRSGRLIDVLHSLGFQRGAVSSPQCFIFGMVGGVAGFGLAGYGLGRMYFGHYDSDVQNGSIYEEQRKFYRDIGFGAVGGAGAGAGLAVLACFKLTGRNYSVEFNPKEIPANPAQRPPVEIPPIDQKPPILDPIPPVVKEDPVVVPPDPVIVPPVVKPDPVVVPQDPVVVPPVVKEDPVPPVKPDPVVVPTPGA